MKMSNNNNQYRPQFPTMNRMNIPNLAALLATPGTVASSSNVAIGSPQMSQPSSSSTVVVGGTSRPQLDETDAMISTIEKNLYRDNSRVTPADVEANPLARRSTSKREPTFPMKLHNLLSDPDAEGIITWLPHGRSWKVLNQDKFETTLLPRFFEHGNISSFMRQVNGWDFRRVVKGTDENSYYHELFLRGMPHLCRMMTRSKNSGKKKDAGALCSPKLLSITPDFYRISRDHPLPETNMPDDVQSNVYGISCEQQQASAAGDTSTSVLSHVAQQAQQPQQQGHYTDLAAQALQNYIHDTSAGAQNQQLTNLQAFQQRLQARSMLVDSLRSIVSQQQGVGTTSVPTLSVPATPSAANVLLNNHTLLRPAAASTAQISNNNLALLGSNPSLVNLLGHTTNPGLTAANNNILGRSSNPNLLSNVALLMEITRNSNARNSGGGHNASW